MGFLLEKKTRGLDLNMRSFCRFGTFASHGVTLKNVLYGKKLQSLMENSNVPIYLICVYIFIYVCVCILLDKWADTLAYSILFKLWNCKSLPFFLFVKVIFSVLWLQRSTYYKKIKIKRQPPFQLLPKSQ